MSKIKNSSMFFLWSGAAISIAEIYTGCLVAPLGFSKGIASILLGHLIGVLFLAFGGYISFMDKKNAMEKVKDYFGEYGAKIIAIFNILQLIGWSAVMIIQSSRALTAVLPLNSISAVIVTAIVVFLWSYFFNNYSKKVNDISVVILIIICIMMFFSFDVSKIIPSQDSISFTTAMELSIAMPVSWLPLIGDYTKYGESGKGVFLTSFLGYFVGSSLMFTLGLAISIFTGKDVVDFLTHGSVRWAAVIIILLSTVTTAFLDIYSAVISTKQIIKFKNNNFYVLIYSILAALIAFVFPIENYQNFLLAIGSVFVPVYTVVFTDYILRTDFINSKFNISGIVFAALGVLLYNYFTKISFGTPTLLVFIIISLTYLSYKKIFFLGGLKNEH